MNKRFFATSLTCSIVCWLAVVPPAFAQVDEDEEPLVLEVYDVSDLVLTPPDYAYPGGGIPTVGTTGTHRLLGTGQPTGGGFGGGIGGGGFGGGGGGLFSVPAYGSTLRLAQFGGSGFGGIGSGSSSPASESGGLRYTIDDLKEAILSTVAPDSWDEEGGSGVCTPLGAMLLIQQTEKVHREIAILFAGIRRTGTTSRTVSIEAQWLLLDSGQYAELAGNTKSGGKTAGLTVVDREQLGQLAAQVPGYFGRLTCFNGQTVHLVSGDRRTLTTSVMPTVGHSAVAYQPVTATANVGILLQLSPLVLPNSQVAVLDVQSTVTGWKESPEPIQVTGRQRRIRSISEGTNPSAGSSTTEVVEGPEGTVITTVDRINLPTQQWMTTLRVPLGQPVLVGGISITANDRPLPELQAGGVKQLCLFVEMTATEPSAP